jgi:hypothetical protein
VPCLDRENAFILAAISEFRPLARDCGPGRLAAFTGPKGADKADNGEDEESFGVLNDGGFGADCEDAASTAPWPDSPGGSAVISSELFVGASPRSAETLAMISNGLRQRYTRLNAQAVRNGVQAAPRWRLAPGDPGRLELEYASAKRLGASPFVGSDGFVPFSC